MFFYPLALLIAGLDQLLKYLVQRDLAVGQSVTLVDHVLKLTHVHNTGAAFSLFVGFSPYLAAVGLAVAVLVVVMHHRTPARQLALQLGLALVLGGSLGNLLDRVTRQYVIDYLDFIVWPVFNLADVAINAGVIILAYQLFVREKNDAADAA